MFPASKATTLEANNKSLTKTPQSVSTASSGNKRSRHRRSVDEHASITSNLPTVDVHDTTPISSFPHGVASENTEGAIASVSPIVVNTGLAIENIPVEITNVNVAKSSKVGENNEITTETITINIGDSITNISTNPHAVEVKGKEKTDPNTKHDKVEVKTKFVTKTTNINIEQPIDITDKIATTTKTEKDIIAYDPEDMQGDSFSLWYGAQKLQYVKMQMQLKQVNEELHINLNDTVVSDKNLDKYHYDSETTVNKSEFSVPLIKNATNTEPPIFNNTNVNDVIVVTTNKFTTLEHVTTPSATIVTNNNLVNTSSVSSSTTTTARSTPSMNSGSTTEKLLEEATTVIPNIAETKTPEIINPKHVLINLTISSDEEGSSYKPLYSLTVTVPTLADTNEIPSLKITPLDVEPTQQSNFNKPVTIETTTKDNKIINNEDLGGSCECSCPVCNLNSINSTDDFYDDYKDATTDSPDLVTTQDSSSESTATTEENFTGSTTEYSAKTTTDLYVSSTTENIDTTTDYETTKEVEISTTDLPKCVCPKIEPPPILILEGEVEFE